MSGTGLTDVYGGSFYMKYRGDTFIGFTEELCTKGINIEPTAFEYVIPSYKDESEHVKLVNDDVLDAISHGIMSVSSDGGKTFVEIGVINGEIEYGKDISDK